MNPQEQVPYNIPNMIDGEEVAKLFVCHICDDIIVPQILQCQEGHIFCSTCRARMEECALCRAPLNMAIRNLQMECLWEITPFACQYRQHGCINYFLYKDKERHESLCEFRPYGCPIPQCEWKGYVEEFLLHISLSHPSIPIVQGETFFFKPKDMALPNIGGWIILQHCLENYFVIHFLIQRNQGTIDLYGHLNLFGTNDEAKKFEFKMTFASDNFNIQWEGVPRSIREGVSPTIKANCIKFENCLVNDMIDNVHLGINIVIYKIEN